jgi:hypothetical protein
MQCKYFVKFHKNKITYTNLEFHWITCLPDYCLTDICKGFKDHLFISNHVYNSLIASKLGPEFKITTLIGFRIILGTTLVGFRICIGTTLMGSWIILGIH